MISLAAVEDEKSHDGVLLSMESDLGQALAATGTSNSWSPLDAVASKVGRRLGRSVTPRELDSFIRQAGETELRRNGVWVTRFPGKDYMPIILVNPAFARSAKAAIEAEGAIPSKCTCGATPVVESSSSKKPEEAKRYFGSHDYNAGRHSVTTSAHKANCLMWRPPTTGHLHSWRRAFSDSKK